MANINGLPVNSAVTHAEFMSRTEDTSTVAKVSLQDPDVDSGPAIQNIQKGVNLTFTAVGAVDENDPAVNDYLSTNYVNNGDDRKVAIGKLDTQLKTTQDQLSALDLINSQDITIEAIGSTPNANGATLTGQSLNLEPASASFGGVLTTGVQSIAGDKTFIDDVAVSSTLTVTGLTTLNGDLVVNGTTTTVNSATVDTIDPNITVNKTGNNASSEGAGLTVDRTGTKGSLIYANASPSRFKAGDLGSEIEIVNLSSSQTLTNKTLTSPVINTPTGITKTDVGLSNVTNDAQLKRSANDFNTFTEKTALVDDDVFIIEDSAASGAKKFVKKSNIGASGSGGGSVNLITNGSADNASASIFVPYLNTAQRLPVTGTGGSPTVTTSITSTNPLVGTKSYLLTKPASNTQGQGWSVPFAVDLGYRAKVLNITVDYIVNSGTFVSGSSTTDSDVIWYLYDITNSQLIEPSSIKMLSSSTTLTDQYRSTFQTSATGSSYRLIAHCATPSALAYEIKVDNITVSPSVYVYGTPITDFKTVTNPTIVGSTSGTYNPGTGSTYRTEVAINGQEWLVNYYIDIGTSAVDIVGAHVFNLPAECRFHSDVQPYETVGYGEITNVATANPVARMAAKVFGGYTSNQVILDISDVGLLNNASGFMTNSSNIVTVKLRFKGMGLSSSVQMSDSADTRICFAKASFSATVIPTQAAEGSETLIQFSSAINDTHGALTTGAGSRFTAQSAGFYKASGALVEITGSGTYAVIGKLFKNGVQLNSRLFRASVVSVDDGYTFADTVYLNAGDYVDIRVFQNSGSNKNFSAASWFNIEKIQGPSAIAASESVNCRYTTNSGQTINNTFPTVIFGTKVYDSHGSYNSSTGIFTAPVYGKYRVTATLAVAASAFPATQDLECLLYKNGSAYSELARSWGNGSNINLVSSGSDTVELLAGQTISVVGYTAFSATLLTNGGVSNHIAIEKVG